MKKIVYLLVLAVVFSCSSAKQTQNSINSGNYVSAINTAVNKLRSNKTRKGNQDIVLLLEEAFAKHTERELRDIDYLKKDGNPANYEKIYNTYLDLESVQSKIEPLLPLRVYDEDRDANIKLVDYTNDILAAKNSLSEYLYNNASNLITNAQSKYDFRKAYDDFKYLQQLNPNFKDTRDKIEEAYQKGIEYVSVNIYNDTDIVLPARLEEDLLNFNTYGLNNLWTRFHTNQQDEITYDYEMQLKFNDILISPEQVKTNVTIKEKEVKDGWKYVLDENGNVKKDSLGNDIKEDKFKIVKSKFYEHVQFKDAQISGNVAYFDLKTKQLLNTYPLTSGYTFEHMYAEYEGDKRALNNEMLELTEVRPIPFPSNEQMVYDSGEDLKNRIKSIIKRHGFN